MYIIVILVLCLILLVLIFRTQSFGHTLSAAEQSLGTSGGSERSKSGRKVRKKSPKRSRSGRTSHLDPDRGTRPENAESTGPDDDTSWLELLGNLYDVTFPDSETKQQHLAKIRNLTKLDFRTLDNPGYVLLITRNITFQDPDLSSATRELVGAFEESMKQ